MELERRAHAILEENELLQTTVDDLREKSMLLERQWNEKDLQVRTHARTLPSHTQADGLKTITQQKPSRESGPLGEILICEFVLYVNVHGRID